MKLCIGCGKKIGWESPRCFDCKKSQKSHPKPLSAKKAMDDKPPKPVKKPRVVRPLKPFWPPSVSIA